MNRLFVRIIRAGIFLLICANLPGFSGPSCFAGSRLDEVLARTGRMVEEFWNQIPYFDCRELVTREKVEKKGKVEFRQKLEFDYVALTRFHDGELTVEELRLPLKKAGPETDVPPLLETNGFPSLLLIFHPRYRPDYRFQMEDAGLDIKGSLRIRFEHISGADSTSAVMIQGKAYALDLQGIALIDRESGAIQKISASLISPMKDINVDAFAAEVTYELRHLSSDPEPRWLPSKAMIDLGTSSQHWRNVHLYSAYRRFVVEAQEVAGK